MNFNEWYKYHQPQKSYPSNIIDCDFNERRNLKKGWNVCKKEILLLLEKNKELEAISQDGKKIYKIYGNVIDKINKEI